MVEQKAKKVILQNVDGEFLIPYVEKQIPNWGEVQGNILDQADLKQALDEKQPVGDYATNSRVDDEVSTINQSLATKQPKLTAGEGIEITENNVINNTRVSAEWGKIQGNLSDQEDLKNELDSKQDTLIQGENISIQNNVISADVPEILFDERTIGYNEDDDVEAIGIHSLDGSYNSFWVGSKADYQQAVSDGVITPETLCHITDDIEDVLVEIPNATYSDVGLVKPDQTVFTIDDTGKMGLPNATDFCFQSIYYGGGESGYRKYRNGYMEQWGVATTTDSGETEFTLHQAYMDTKFSIFIEPREMGNFFHYAYPSANQKFKCRLSSSSGYIMAVKVQWRSYGRWK